MHKKIRRTLKSCYSIIHKNKITKKIVPESRITIQEKKTLRKLKVESTWIISLMKDNLLQAEFKKIKKKITARLDYRETLR